MARPPVLHILGFGAVGRLWAYHLIAAGQRVTAHGRQGTIKGQIRLVGSERPLALSDDPGGNMDYLMVSVKAFQLKDALQAIQHRLSDQSSLVLAMNGMGFEDLVLKLTPVKPNRLFYLVSSHGALAQRNQLAVQHTGVGQAWLGSSDSVDRTYREQWLQLLSCPLLNGWEPNIRQKRWLKLGVNALINPLASVLDCLNGALLCPPVTTLWQSLAEEFACVAKAEQVDLDADELLAEAQRVARKTAGNSCSMREDMRHARDSELDFITGFVIDRANANGLSVPSHQMLLNLVRGKQHIAREQYKANRIKGEHP